ncbi:MAG: helix-turn-helix transcriptional regulator [Chloroflexi bacterium]|nr:helix-turn-helix transcriptional regulator [Chloroflexota bacterium]
MQDICPADWCRLSLPNLRGSRYPSSIASTRMDVPEGVGPEMDASRSDPAWQVATQSSPHNGAASQTPRARLIVPRGSQTNGTASHGTLTDDDGVVSCVAHAPERPHPLDALRARLPNQLTRREREIAALIGEGMTSRQIAERLIISLRTVDAHAEHIRSKFGLHSRAQIAAWAVDQGIVERPPR